MRLSFVPVVGSVQRQRLSASLRLSLSGRQGQSDPRFPQASKVSHLQTSSQPTTNTKPTSKKSSQWTRHQSLQSVTKTRIQSPSTRAISTREPCREERKRQTGAPTAPVTTTICRAKHLTQTAPIQSRMVSTAPKTSR